MGSVKLWERLADRRALKRYNKATGADRPIEERFAGMTRRPTSIYRPTSETATFKDVVGPDVNRRVIQKQKDSAQRAVELRLESPQTSNDTKVQS
jgi:hypothetical protein